VSVKFTNNAETTLASGINSSVTSLTVASSTDFPTITTGEYFYVTLDDGTNNEIVKVTAVSGTTWTIVRAQDNTTARSFSFSNQVELRVTAGLITDAVADALASSFAKNAFTGDGTETNFTLSQSPNSEDDLIVFIEGVFQNQSTYSLSGTTLTFSTAPANTRAIVVYTVKAAVSGANLNHDQFTASGSAAFTLSIAPINENNTQVFIDGVYQQKTDYAVSGTTLTFDTAPASGAIVEVMTFTQTEVNVPATGSVVAASIANDVNLNGNPTTTTQSAGNNTTRIATTAFVEAAVSNLIDSAPNTMNTLNEIAAALGDDPTFTTTVNNAIATKLPLAGGTMTGNIAHASDFTLDVGGDIILDADGGDIYFKDAGTTTLQFKNSQIYSLVANADLKLIVNDGGSNVNALVFDASDAGTAIFNHDITLPDNGKAIFGAGSDLQIYHDGSNSYIQDSGTGTLRILSDDVRIMNATGTEISAQFIQDGEARLKYDNATKLATKSSGIDVTGDITLGDTNPTITFNDSSISNLQHTIASGSNKLQISTDPNQVHGSSKIEFLVDATERMEITSSGVDVTGVITTDGLTTSADINFGDNDKAIFGAGSDLQIYHDGSNSYVQENGTGALVIQSNGTAIVLEKTDGENMILANTDGDVKLYYNGSEKLATTSTGIDVTGTAVTDGLTVESSSTGTLNVVNFLNTDTSNNQSANRLGLGISNSAGANYTYIEAKETGTDAFAEMNFYTGSTTTKRLTLGIGGDISFYDDTGSTQGLFWDSSAESLGIGTTSPLAVLDVVRGGATGLSSVNARTSLLVQNNLSNGTVLSINAKNTGYSGIFLGDPENEAQGQIKQDHTTNAMQFTSSGAAAEMVLKAGNVGIGTESPSSLLHMESGNAHNKLSITSTASGGTGYDAVIDLLGSASNSEVAINMGINGNADREQISTYQSVMKFKTNDTERMRIDSSGLSIIGGRMRNPSTSGTWEVRTGGRSGTGTYTLFTNGASNTQSAGIVEVWGIYGTPSGASYNKFVISGNRSIATIVNDVQTNSVPNATVSWNGSALQVTNSDASLFYHVRVELHDIGNGWSPTWGNFPDIS